MLGRLKVGWNLHEKSFKNGENKVGIESFWWLIPTAGGGRKVEVVVALNDAR